MERNRSDMKLDVQRKVSNSEKKRKVILHFDVRNTVIAADSISNEDTEQALNSYLSGVTWGKEGENGSWTWCSKTPSTKPPEEGCVTLYKHLEKEIVHNPEDRALLRKITADFTKNEHGDIFRPYLDKHLELLKWNDSEYNDDALTIRGKNGELYHYLVPAFIKLIFHLYDNERDFTVIFRTYGLDATNVVKAVELTLQGHHPDFPRKIPINVRHGEDRILRNDDGIKLETKDNQDKTLTLTSCNNILENLTKREGISAIRDDFVYWQKNDYNHHAGKPLWIDLSDHENHHVFFDDLMRCQEMDSIVDLRHVEPMNGKTKETSLSLSEMQELEDIFLVQANLLNSTEDPNYFIKELSKCEKNYDDFIDKYVK